MILCNGNGSFAVGRRTQGESGNLLLRLGHLLIGAVVSYNLEIAHSAQARMTQGPYTHTTADRKHGWGVIEVALRASASNCMRDRELLSFLSIPFPGPPVA